MTPRERWWMFPSEGTEPDYRFTLANERTFLAWVRTSLGLLAGGVAIRQLAPDFGTSALRTAIALVAITASLVAAIGAYARWIAVQRAIRRGDDLPPTPLAPFVMAGFAVIALLALVGIATD